MALKYRIAALNEVDAKHQDLYVADGDKGFVLQVEGAKAEEEFTKVMNALTKERSDHKLKAAELRDVKVQLDEALASAKTIEELANNADASKADLAKLRQTLATLEREKVSLTEGKQELEGKLGAYETKERRAALHLAVGEACKKMAMRPEAVEDACLQAETLFNFTDGAIVVKNTSAPYADPQGWLASVRASKTHWWPESSGAGATGSGSGSGGANPWKKDQFNLTEQGTISREQPKLAAQLKKQAGIL